MWERKDERLRNAKTGIDGKACGKAKRNVRMAYRIDRHYREKENKRNEGKEVRGDIHTYRRRSLMLNTTHDTTLTLPEMPAEREDMKLCTYCLAYLRRFPLPLPVRRMAPQVIGDISIFNVQFIQSIISWMEYRIIKYLAINEIMERYMHAFITTNVCQCWRRRNRLIDIYRESKRQNGDRKERKKRRKREEEINMHVWKYRHVWRHMRHVCSLSSPPLTTTTTYPPTTPPLGPTHVRGDDMKESC